MSEHYRIELSLPIPHHGGVESAVRLGDDLCKLISEETGEQPVDSGAGAGYRDVAFHTDDPARILALVQAKLPQDSVVTVTVQESG